MSSPLVGPPVAKVQAMHCPQCGGTVEFRGFGHAMTVVCTHCLTVLDASSPLLQIVQKAVFAQSKRTPLIPLGQRGNMAGATWECIGFQTRAVEEDGVTYEWAEYLLFNPYKGFRYLTNYDGHWNFVTPVESLPERKAIGSRPAVFFEGNLYRHFSGAQAMTNFVLGEFPWRVKVGDEVLADDFVHPPLVLSSETTSSEVTWSLGQYTQGSDVWKAFKLPGNPPRANGVYLNQPSPFGGKIGSVWGLFGLMLTMLVVIAIAFGVLSRNDTVFDQHYRYSTADTGEPSFVTKVFDIDGHTSTLRVTVNTGLINNWAYFNLTLINDTTGEAYDFGREVSYYSGSDSDGLWEEGKQSESIDIPRVPPGKYYLRVEPEMEGSPEPPVTDPKTGASKTTAQTNTSSKTTAPPVPASQKRTITPLQQRLANVTTVYYEIVMRHDVASYGWFWLAALFLLIPPIIYTIRAGSFETRRWSSSDYPPTPGGG